MNLNDFMTTNILFNYINKIDSGCIIIDFLYIIIMSSAVLYCLTPNFKYQFFKKIEGYTYMFDSTNRIIFTSKEKESSKRYRSIMYYISNSNDNSVKSLSEIVNWKFNRRDNDYEESKNSVYRVDQYHKFTIDKKLGIEGKVYSREKENSEHNGKINYAEYNYLEIFSKKLKMVELEKWVEKRVDEYNQNLATKSCNKQQLVEISWNPKNKDLDIYYNNWESNVTFENRFFENKDKILSKINFFLNNPEWYKKRGIPYTLGFLLWGEPGCGKTGFIKALMNLTNRHGISIKLNDKFDMNRLREIIYDDELYEDLIIPQQNRILIFEDVDCMGEIIKDRDIKDKLNYSIPLNNEPNNIQIKKKSYDDDYVSVSEENDNVSFNNNLSFFLNILDGLQECPGRIIIMTTNKPDQLDKALIRPGRIDYNIHFTKAKIEDVKNIIKYYWNKPELELILTNTINERFSHAEIVNYCRTSETAEETIKKLINNI